jgi:hypothetical protein
MNPQNTLKTNLYNTKEKTANRLNITSKQNKTGITKHFCSEKIGRKREETRKRNNTKKDCPSCKKTKKKKFKKHSKTAMGNKWPNCIKF